jgi:hypothetical protein
MTLKILVWNAQHFDNQSKSVYSEAYQQKLTFLTQYVAEKEPVDIIALLETGKTGNVNNTLASSLQDYLLLSHLDQEGGARKNTTLGSSVYVHRHRMSEFAAAEFQFALGHNEQRAPLVIKHKSSKYFAFYHANANERTSFDHIKSAIEYILQLKKKLVFFGGDMNYDFIEMNSVIAGMQKLGPPSPGYTHTKFSPVPTLELDDHAIWKYEYLINRQKLTHAFNGGYAKAVQAETVAREKDKQAPLPANKRHSTAKSGGPTQKRRRLDERFRQVDDLFDRQYSFQHGGEAPESVVVTHRFLDYAMVDDLTAWTAQCDGSIKIDWNSGLPVYTRLCSGKEMRSDHFPVLYTYSAL